MVTIVYKNQQQDEEQDRRTGGLSDLLEGENFRIVSDYMEDRFGMTEDKYDRQEIVDSYINNMRQFSVGQSVTTLQELSHLNRGDNQELDLRRKKAGDAYKLFDSLGGAFGEDRTFGEKADAVYDYARALIVDPVNLISLGVGKLAAAGAAKGAAEIAKQGARQAAVSAVKNSAASGITSKAAIEAAKREASRRAYSKAIQSSAYKESLKSAAKREILAAGAASTAAATGFDALMQKARVKAGAQDEYNPVQGAFATIGGLTGTGLAYGLTALRGVSGNAMLSLELDRSADVMEAARIASAKAEKEAIKDAAERLRKENLAKYMNQDRILADMSVLTKQIEPFKAKIKRGIDIRYTDLDDRASATDAVLSRLFFLGDKEAEIKGVKQILEEAGLPRWVKRSQDDRFTNYMGDAIKALKPEAKAKVDEAFEEIFGAFDSPYAKLGVEKFLDVNAAEVSDAARKMATARHLNQSLKAIDKAAEQTDAKEIVESVLDGIKVEPFSREGISDKISKVQSNLIKMIVTHPGTTALNVIGWANATTTQSMSDMVRAALYSGTAFANLAVGRFTKASEYSNLAKHMVISQKQKLMNVVDPYSTFEASMDYLTFRPEAQKELFRYMIGGVEVDNVLKELELPVGQPLTRTSTEKVMNTIQTVYGVKAQDFVTKTQEFMNAIDRNIRIEYGMGYNEFLKRDDLVQHMLEKGTDKYKRFLEIETKSVEDALRNVFSKKYGGSGGTLQRIARVVEDARSYPIIGAMVPFGQFFNNTLGFMFDHTGVSLLHKAVVGTNRDTLDLVTKASVGWGLIGLNTVKEMKNLEEGLAWYQERDETGAVRNRLYDFPYSFYKMLGRVGAHAYRDGEIPQELLDEAGRTFGTEQISRQLGDAAGTAINAIRMLGEGEFGEARGAAIDALGASAAMYVSGFTRFADPANQIVAMTRGEDYVAVDRKQGIKAVNDSIRYIDQIFEVATGESIAPEKRTAVTGERQGVPIGRIFGYREELPQSTVQQMFNDIGRPQWLTEIRSSVPEAANAFNDFVFPILEMYSDSIMESNKWPTFSLEEKKKAVNRVLRLAKADAKDFLKESYDKDDNKVGLIFQITNRNISKRELREALGVFDTSVDELWKLDVPQLELIDFFLKDKGQRDKLFNLELGI